MRHTALGQILFGTHSYMKDVYKRQERKERMDTSSLMEQILSSDNLNRAYPVSYTHLDVYKRQRL